MKKLVSVLCAAAIMAGAVVMPGCSSGTSTSSTAASSAASAAASSAAASGSSSASTGVPKYEDIQFPDTAPTSGITPTDDSKTRYAYDDMSKSYDVSILLGSYGTPALGDKDPIKTFLEKELNVKIKLELLSTEDLTTAIATRSASNDLPDLFQAPDQATAKSLYEQGLLLDGKTVYPYMPLVRQYVTKNMIAYTTDTDGGLYCTTNYNIQDGIWTFCYRKDWLKKFNMEVPTTEAQLMDYAKKCTFDDPDGNGKADTYFMITACGGTSVTGSMNTGFTTMFGDPTVHTEDGKLVHPYFDGSKKKVLTLLNSFVNAKVLYPDWYTIDWDKAQSYQFNDKIGCVYYPPMTLVGQYCQAKNHVAGCEDVWTCSKDTPIENGKFSANGNVGTLWCWAKKSFDGNDAKLMRVAHMVDSMDFGGDYFFDTIQMGSDRAWQSINYTIECPRTWKYSDNGTFYFYNSSKGNPYNDQALNTSTCPWQNFGLPVAFQRNAEEGDDAQLVKENKAGNVVQNIQSQSTRWPNSLLLCPVTDESISSGITDYVNAEELKFVTGKRSLDEWDTYTKEWLAKGGKAIIEADAKQLKVDVPDYAK